MDESSKDKCRNNSYSEMIIRNIKVFKIFFTSKLYTHINYLY